MTVLFSSRFCTHQVRWRARASSPHLLCENTYKLAQEEQGVTPTPPLQQPTTLTPTDSLPHTYCIIQGYWVPTTRV